MSTTGKWQNMEWDEQKVSLFWDFVSQWEPWQDDYFSKQVGKGLVTFLRQVVPIQGRVLDYGCGPGFLIDNLIKSGICCEGMDFSRESVDKINRRFEGHPLWKGAKVARGGVLPYPDNAFDLIICVETIEHVLDPNIDNMLNELHRILKPGTGRLLITTPNNENLAVNSAYCSNCNSVFHKYQHVRSFTTDSLNKMMNGHEFDTLMCNTTIFNHYQEKLLKNPLDWSPRYLVNIIKEYSAILLDRLHLPFAPVGGYQIRRNIGNGNHLFWLGYKK